MTRRGVVSALLAAATLLGGAGCMPLPPQGAINAGPVRDQWSIIWDPEFRTPAQMTNRSLQDEVASGPAVSETVAEDAVRKVIEGNPDWFRMRPDIDDFRVAQSYAAGWLRSLRIVQTYRDLPVLGAGYDVRVLGSGRVGSLEGRLHPDIRIDVMPILGPEQAQAMAETRFHPTGTATSSLPHFQFEANSGLRSDRMLVILPGAGGYRLAWGVVVRRPPDGVWRVYLDSANGDLIGDQYLGDTWR